MRDPPRSTKLSVFHGFSLFGRICRVFGSSRSGWSGWCLGWPISVGSIGSVGWSGKLVRSDSFGAVGPGGRFERVGWCLDGGCWLGRLKLVVSVESV